MNKLPSSGKNKLRTLPNQLHAGNLEGLAYKSQCDQEYTKKFSIASPTFATTELCQPTQQAFDKTKKADYTGKQNKITLCLREYKNNENENISNRGSCDLKGQNDRLVDRCKELEGRNTELEEKLVQIERMYTSCKKKLEKKYCEKTAQILHLGNGTDMEKNIDLYLEVQVIKEDYKKMEEKSRALAEDNKIKDRRIKDLEEAMLNYEQKSEKKKIESEEGKEKIAKIEKIHTEKVQELRKKYQAKIKELESEKNQKEKTAKKNKDEYEKLKFLKQQIEKKRQQDLRSREQLQKEISQKTKKIQDFKIKISELIEQKKQLLKNQQINSSTQEQLNEAQIQLGKLKLALSLSESQMSKYQHQIQSYKVLNEKYMNELNFLRQENLQALNNYESAKMQKSRLESALVRCKSSEDKLQEKILQLEEKISQTERQIQSVNQQYEQMVSKYSARDSKQHEEPVKEVVSRLTENDRLNDNLDTVKGVEQKFSNIIKGLNGQIQQLRKCRESMVAQLQVEKQRNYKLQQQLEGAYRRIQELSEADPEKQAYREQPWARSKQMPAFEVTRTTKAAPQLKMIREILLSILDIEEEAKSNLRLTKHKQKQPMPRIQSLIDEIKVLAEHTADYFDDRSKQIQVLSCQVEKKEQVISKLLRFTPEQKKGCILDYLKVMEQYDEYSADQVYKVTKTLQQQASQWRRYITGVLNLLEKKQEQISALKMQIGRRGETAGRKYETGYERYEREVNIKNDYYPEKEKYPRRRF